MDTLRRSENGFCPALLRLSLTHNTSYPQNIKMLRLDLAARHMRLRPRKRTRDDSCSAADEAMPALIPDAGRLA